MLAAELHNSTNLIHAPISEGCEIALQAVEARMIELTTLDGQIFGTVQRAIQHHLCGGGSRTRAAIGLSSGSALNLTPEDSIGLATCAELLHNASLVHDDLQDRTPVRRGREAVWTRFGEPIAICAGDLLVSAAYSSLASMSSTTRYRDLPSMTKYRDLLKALHSATCQTINGQASDLLLQDVGVSDFAVYKRIAGEKSGPLIALPMELALITAGYPSVCHIARKAATDFAVAYQIADDLEDERTDAGGNSRPQCLNAVTVLRDAACDNARSIARRQARCALNRAAASAKKLPKGSGIALMPHIDAVKDKLEAAMT